MNKLQEIENRLNNTTPGKWYAENNDMSWDLYASNGEYHPLKLIKAPKKSEEFMEYFPDKNDEDFIVNAKDDIAYLLSEIKRLNQIINNEK